jgi:uncharacterized protein YPO0396
MKRKRVAKPKSEIQELSEFVRDHMATKSDIADIRHDIADIRHDIEGVMSELKDIKQRLKVVEVLAENHSGFKKEIDHVLSRIRAIEKHLGIKKPVSA